MPTMSIIQAFGVILTPRTPSKCAFRSLPETIVLGYPDYPDIRDIWLPIMCYPYLPDGKTSTIRLTPDSVFTTGYTPYPRGVDLLVAARPSRVVACLGSKLLSHAFAPRSGTM